MSEDNQNNMQAQMMIQQISMLQQQLSQLSQQIEDLKNTKKAIDDLDKTEKGSEILAPISNGIFVRARLLDNKKFIVNVGADTTIKKTKEELKELIDNQLKDMNNLEMEMRNNLNKMNIQFRKLQE